MQEVIINYRHRQQIMALKAQNNIEMTPSKRKNFTQIPSIQVLHKTTKPFIQLAQRQELNEKLELQKIAMGKVNERMKRNQLMLSYDYNPFSDPESTGAELNLQNKVLIMHGALNITEQPVREQFQRLRMEFYDETGTNLKFMEKGIQIFSQKKQYFKKPIKPEKVHNKGQEKDIVDSLPVRLSLIRRIEQENINLKKGKDFNLYEEVYKYRHGMHKHYLEEHRFIQKTQENYSTQIKLGTYRDLSKMARMLAQGEDKEIDDDIQQHLDAEELSFNPKNLLFRDIMNMSSGRFSPMFMVTMQFSNPESKQSKHKPIADDSEEAAIEYQPYQTSTQVNTEWIDVQKFEIQCLKEAPLEQEERIVREKLNLLYRDLKRELDEKANMLADGIVDNQVHEQRKQKIVDLIKQFRLGETNEPGLDIASIVRKKRTNKDKKEQLKLKSLRQAISATIESKQIQMKMRESLFN